MEIQTIRDPVGGQGHGSAGGAVRGQGTPVVIGRLHLAVLALRDPDEHADVRATRKIDHLAAILDRFPGHLQQQPLLRINERSLPRRDAKKTALRDNAPEHPRKDSFQRVL